MYMYTPVIWGENQEANPLSFLAKGYNTHPLVIYGENRKATPFVILNTINRLEFC